MAAIYRNGFQFVDMKQQNRFIMDIQDYYTQGQGNQSYLVRATDLPSVENNPVPVDTINAEYKIKGKSRWQDISVTFYDPIYNSPGLSGDTGATRAHKWMKDKHHNSYFNVDGYMSTYKRKITLYYINPQGTPTGEKWELNGAFFANLNWGSVDVSSDDLVLIEATISYDWAQLTAGGGGAGGGSNDSQSTAADGGQSFSDTVNNIAQTAGGIGGVAAAVGGLLNN